MANKKEIKRIPVSVSMLPELKNRITKEAKKNLRTFTSQVCLILEKHTPRR